VLRSSVLQSLACIVSTLELDSKELYPSLFPLMAHLLTNRQELGQPCRLFS
jgi:hypothetical protein